MLASSSLVRTWKDSGKPTKRKAARGFFSARPFGWLRPARIGNSRWLAARYFARRVPREQAKRFADCRPATTTADTLSGRCCRWRSDIGDWVIGDWVICGICDIAIWRMGSRSGDVERANRQSQIAMQYHQITYHPITNRRSVVSEYRSLFA